MTIAHIVERFAMDLGDTPPERDSWFLDYVLRSPKQAGIHLTAGWLAMNSLKEVYRGADDISTCREYFGGMGAQALMAQRLFNLKDHIVLEYNPQGVDHLIRVLPDRVNGIFQADSYEPGWSKPADLVLLDFGDLTVWKTREGEQHRDLLDRVFLMEPKAVVFTDIACRYLHLHRERYEGLLGAGTCVSYETYLAALLGRLRDLYGYRLVRGYHDRWSTVMALVPEDVSWDEDMEANLVPTPDRPVGLELL